MTNNLCPLCGKPGVVRCKCPRGDMQCAAGHEWHTCTIHNNVVVGASNHSIPTYRCTCKIGDTESGSTIVNFTSTQKSSVDIGANI